MALLQDNEKNIKPTCNNEKKIKTHQKWILNQDTKPKKDQLN